MRCGFVKGPNNRTSNPKPTKLFRVSVRYRLELLYAESRTESTELEYLIPDHDVIFQGFRIWQSHNSGTQAQAMNSTFESLSENSQNSCNSCKIPIQPVYHSKHILQTAGLVRLLLGQAMAQL